MSTSRSDPGAEVAAGSPLFVGGVRRAASSLSDALSAAASGLLRPITMLRRPRRTRLVQQGDGVFAVETGEPESVRDGGQRIIHIAGGKIVEQLPSAVRSRLTGSQVEIALFSQGFVFRPLELPKRAAEFLEGIIRAQIDRLTPWRPADAVFGWSAPSSAGPDRIEVTVAATARKTIEPMIAALEDLRPASIVLLASAEAPDTRQDAIRIVVHQRGRALQVERLRLWLTGILIAAFLAAVASTGASLLVGEHLDAQRSDLARRIADRRASLSGGHGTPADDALAALMARKRAVSATVIVLELLSRILPDDTYLTDLQIEHGTLRIAGLTHDAPALIQLIEQSKRFSQAQFSTATTKSPTEDGERFHIEARIEPVMPVPR